MPTLLLGARFGDRICMLLRLQVYDGINSHSTLLATLTGTLITVGEAAVASADILGRSGSMYLELLSDSRSVGPPNPAPRRLSSGTSPLRPKASDTGRTGRWARAALELLSQFLILMPRCAHCVAVAGAVLPSFGSLPNIQT